MRTYQLKGQVLVVKPETNEVLVKHEDIKGFMPAMTMPYTVDDDADAQGSSPLEISLTRRSSWKSNRAYLRRITKTGSAPLPEDARTTIPAAAGVHILQAGDTVPDTPLIDQDGKPISLEGLSRLRARGQFHLHALSVSRSSAR